MMKFTTSLLLVFLTTALVANAQLREDLSYQPEQYTTSVSTEQHSGPGNWMNLLNMTMSHSYSMTFSNFGGQMQNMNAYTNHMFFDVSERFKAQLDVSVLHSPFGNSFMNNDNSLNAHIIIDQARIDYQLSPNATISFQFSQRPAYYGRGAYFSPFHNRMSPWY